MKTSEMSDAELVLEIERLKMIHPELARVPLNVIRACLKAKSAGACDYCHETFLDDTVVSVEPLCVIAQLGEMHGISANLWLEGNDVAYGPNSSIGTTKLSDYSMDNLLALQDAWDSDSSVTNEELLLKVAMDMDW